MDQRLKQMNKSTTNRIAVLLSGGVGSRMNLDIPKQYAIVGGKPIIYYSLKALLDNDETDAIVIVISSEWVDFINPILDSCDHMKRIYFAEPGRTRQLSVYNALKVIHDAGYGDDDIILVHEAARPMLKQDLIHSCYKNCEKYDCVVPVMPIKETVYFSEDGRVIDSLMDRSKIWSGQAPEAFRFGKYFRAHLDIPEDLLPRFNGGTELAFHAGLSCCLIEGDPFNFKITTQEDLTHFRSIVEGCGIC